MTPRALAAEAARRILAAEAAPARILAAEARRGWCGGPAEQAEAARTRRNEEFYRRFLAAEAAHAAHAAKAARRIGAELADDGVSIGAAEDAADAARALHTLAAQLDRAGHVLSGAAEMLLDEYGDGLDEATAADLAELATWGDP